jgi:hypothetical protein
VSESEWLSVPVGIDAGRWKTRKGCRTVLVAVHSVVAGQRLIDVVGLIESDPRVQVVYTQAPDIFRTGVGEFLHSIGALEIPWQQAIREPFDLGLAAAYGGLPQLHAPVMVLPHGAGYAKQTPRGESARKPAERSVYGLGAEHLIRDGRVVPASIVLSHEAQLDLLRRHCAEATDVAVVAGDPCYDRLAASMGNRADYRESFGVPSGRQLVLVTSTWGPHSLFARHPDLLATLLRQLDPLRYQVIAMLHPAAWFAHGRRQIRAWFADERTAGLKLIAPEDDWRAAIIAADHVIGDHGSGPVYAASIGKPILYTDLPIGELHDNSAQVFVGSRSPRLRPSQPIEPQLRKASRELPGSWARDVTERLTSRPGHAHRLLREEMYRLLEIPMPGRHRAVAKVPVPGREGRCRHA